MKHDVERVRIRGIGSKLTAFGTEDYHRLARYLLMEIHDSYAGKNTFFWLNEHPYKPEEEFDWFVAGRAFGCVRRKEHGGSGVWQDMQLAWLDDLYRAFNECGYAREIELDGGAVMPVEYVQRLMKKLKFP